MTPFERKPGRNRTSPAAQPESLGFAPSWATDLCSGSADQRPPGRLTTPPKQITVQCPDCGRQYEDWYRASINLDLDDFDESYLREASTATCPDCGSVVELSTLVVKGGIWRTSA
jgi:predicted RNA-binding Zn-ribbon protein involved in translation (DUF1610 family)